jgi:hypothetical protein
MDKKLLSCCFAAAGLFFCACGAEGDWACTTNDDCVEGHLCAAEGVCAPLDPVQIVTESLPAATLETQYRFTLEAADGVPPYDWSLERCPGWMSIDPETGVLSGVPERPAADLSVRVLVRDSTNGRDSWAEAELFMDVNHCAEGQTAACYQAGGDRCFAGTKRCSGGGWSDCGQMEPSSSREHCGPYCEQCIRRSSDGCIQGACACGEASACTGGDACCNAECVDTATDLKNCGGCGIACAELLQDVVAPRCREGTCTFDRCRDDFLDCNQDPADGCETPMGPLNCGACQHDCNHLVQNVTDVLCKLTPEGRRCDYQQNPARGQGCRFGFYDCDGNRENGCETPVSDRNCGACGLACVGSVCRLHPDGDRYYCGCSNNAECGAGRQCCYGYCFNAFDPAHCASCENDCTRQVANVNAVLCDRGTCDYDACLPDYLDCDAGRQNGCEQAMDDDNCGECGFSCGANARCDRGACVCATNRGNCNTEWTDGCEENLLTSEENCGACGNDCYAGVHNASGIICDSGRCDYFECVSDDYADCDGLRQNGCEIDLQTDNRNCGGCGVSCHDYNCVAGSCSAACLQPLAECDGDLSTSCETNPHTDPHNCGGCGNDCGWKKYCCDGTCSLDPC